MGHWRGFDMSNGKENSTEHEKGYWDLLRVSQVILVGLEQFPFFKLLIPETSSVSDKLRPLVTLDIAYIGD